MPYCSTSKFHCYIFGKEVTVNNDHKPLEQIFKKLLLSAPMRIQKMSIRLQWYDLKVCYRKGKEMFISDTLSRAHLPNTDTQTCECTDDSVHMISVSDLKYSEIKDSTNKELSMLREVIMTGWPDTRSETPTEVRPYWDSRDQLSTSDGIIYKGLRIVMPPSLRKYMLNLIHNSHLGIVKCKQQAREVMHWSGMNADIEVTVRDCSRCAEYQNQNVSEPLIPTKTPDLPYSMVGCYLFNFEGKKYVLVVDYFSKFIDVKELSQETTSDIIEVMKSIFSCHGIPRRLRSDSGPQFASREFLKFCKSYGNVESSLKELFRQ
uniref:Integrase catalytic domain-containing protein n=1 Tax=Biomphalaria glabrata TaxID=6526 RepID=A0A2C9L5T5_BIOGL